MRTGNSLHGETAVLCLILLNLDGYLFDEWESGKAEVVKTRLAADFTGWEHDNPKFEAAFEKVVTALRTEGGPGGASIVGRQGSRTAREVFVPGESRSGVILWFIEEKGELITTIVKGAK